MEFGFRILETGLFRDMETSCRDTWALVIDILLVVLETLETCFRDIGRLVIYRYIGSDF